MSMSLSAKPYRLLVWGPGGLGRVAIKEIALKPAPDCGRPSAIRTPLRQVSVYGRFNFIAQHTLGLPSSY